MQAVIGVYTGISKIMDKRTRDNIILIVGFLLILALTVFLMVRGHKKSPEPSPEEEQAKIEEMLDALGHPELAADEDKWMEPNPTSEELEAELLEIETNSIPEVSSTSGANTLVSYNNASVVSCSLYFGGILSVGFENPGITDRIIINPQYRNESDSSNERYYILLCSNDTYLYYDTGDMPSNLPESNCFVITDRTYDTAAPTTSVYWTRGNVLPTNGLGSSQIHIRVMRESDYTIVGTAILTIGTANNGYAITELHSSDVSATGERTFSEREEIINKAVDYIRDTTKGPTFSPFDETYVEIMTAFATVERSDYPYYSRILSSSGDALTAGEIANCDLTIVNLPYLGPGNITIYLAPRLQTEGFHVATTFFSTEEDLLPFAYDFLYPFTKDTLLVPESAIAE